MCPYEKFYGKKPKFWDHLRVFGELAIINNSSHNRFSCKLNNRGEKAMFIGYSTHHSMGTFKFIKVRNKKIVLSRDIKWLDSYEWNDNENMDDEIVELIETESVYGTKENVGNEKINDKCGGSITKKKDDIREISGQNIIIGRTRNEYNRGLISFITCLVSSDIKRNV